MCLCVCVALTFVDFKMSGKRLLSSTTTTTTTRTTTITHTANKQTRRRMRLESERDMHVAERICGQTCVGLTRLYNLFKPFAMHIAQCTVCFVACQCKCYRHSTESTQDREPAKPGIEYRKIPRNLLCPAAIVFFVCFLSLSLPLSLSLFVRQPTFDCPPIILKIYHHSILCVVTWAVKSSFPLHSYIEFKLSDYFRMR